MGRDVVQRTNDIQMTECVGVGTRHRRISLPAGRIECPIPYPLVTIANAGLSSSKQTTCLYSTLLQT